MKTAISVPDPVFEAAEHLARSLGISRSELYSTAVAQFVEQHDASEISARLDRLYSDQSSELDPEVQELQASSLPEGDW
jgi:metal-responsive CopG/Arc/MetJ family transcriptional regulator